MIYVKNRVPNLDTNVADLSDDRVSTSESNLTVITHFTEE